MTKGSLGNCLYALVLESVIQNAVETALKISENFSSGQLPYKFCDFYKIVLACAEKGGWLGKTLRGRKYN